MTDVPGDYERQRNDEQRDRIEEQFNEWLLNGGDDREEVKHEDQHEHSHDDDRRDRRA